MIPSAPSATPAPPATRDDRPAPAPPAPPRPVPPPAPVAAAPAPVPAPTDFWQTDAGRELKADRERIEAVLGRISGAVAELHKDRRDRLQEWQRAAVELALTIAARLLHERVAAEEFPVDAKVRDMIAQLGEDVPVSVRLNPADLKLLRDRLGGAPLSPDQDDPRFVADPTLDRGAVQVEGRESMLLSDVSRELEEIRDELLRSLGNARS
jgi:flagellar biosynthesis/type III secretory pathway protein FliH